MEYWTMTTLWQHTFCNRGQVSILGIIVLLAILSSTFSMISQMHWLLLKIKARSEVYLCHARVAEETEQLIHFLGRTNTALRALSLIPPTPATATNILAIKRTLQLSQRMRSLSFMQKLRAKCSLKNILTLMQRSPYKNFQRHPLDGTLLLEKTNWNYQLQVSIGGLNLFHDHFKILLKGNFKINDRFGNFSRGKMYEVF